MEIIGIAATAVVGVAALGAVALLVASLPDLARYRRLRKM